ncbi:MAG: tripartite tricarboxylate transporter substrate binding protein [Alphaproteobacteria bacterium]|nr:tripartite tricarboxylate transporter substrate binding protein [Alphaproteobacteria bacterium]
MRLSRRSLLAATAASAGALALPGLARAQGAWPTRPVRFIVAYPAGGSTDIVARLMADRLSRVWGQPVVVENRAGAAGTIGADSVAKAAPDGYTLLFAASPEMAIARSTQRNLPYDPVRDFAPISLTATSPFLLVAHPGLAARNVQELVALAKREPGKLNYGSFGIGTSNHFTGELFKAVAGIDIVHVPYRGSAPMLTDLVGGQLQLAFDTFTAALPHVQAGRLRAIGAATPRRSVLAPDVPTIHEQGLTGFTGGSWVGMLAPARTPAAILTRIETDLRALHAAGMNKELQDRGLEPAGSTGAEFRTFIEAEVTKWGDVARRAGIQAQ